jgi:Tfp pilus assembly protein PilO
MKFTFTDKLIAYLALLSGLSISAVAIYYSVAGLVSIFSAAVIPIIVMGVVLEVSKLIATMWLKINWTRAPYFIKAYMSLAIVVLMIITSMGIFGFLSKAHSDQSLVSGDVQSKIAIYDEKIKTAKENIEANRKQLKQMDEAVDQVMGRSSDEKGADKANAIRKSQQRDRSALAKDTEANQKLIAKLNDEAAPIRAEVRKVEAEVGPIKYIAAFIYGDNPDANVLEKAVTWVIIIIVAVFDPLAVILLLASQYSFQWFRKREELEGELTDVKEIETVSDKEVLPMVAEATEQHETLPVDATLLEPSVQPVPAVETVGEPVVLDMPAAIVLPEEVIEEVIEDFNNIERPGDYITPPEEFAPPGTPGEAWSTPMHSEQQPAENSDKIYKASKEDIAKQKRNRGWFNVTYPKRDDTN